LIHTCDISKYAGVATMASKPLISTTYIEGIMIQRVISMISCRATMYAVNGETGVRNTSTRHVARDPMMPAGPTSWKIFRSLLRFMPFSQTCSHDHNALRIRGQALSRQKAAIPQAQYRTELRSYA
jgi:hypothetical protein